MPSNNIRHFRLRLLSSASVPVLDYAELKSRIAQMEQINAGNYYVDP